MILVDTTVWVEHIRYGLDEMVDLLNDNRVYQHELVTLELSCWTPPNRDLFFTSMDKLPKLQAVSAAYVVQFIQLNKLYGKGCGGIDMSLLACVVISGAKLGQSH
ncbi:MAG: VapC toxin family PIN domain ribonuclease [Colwellia sp.]|nr:VapC toxin family PIN domain ribonuclease [Colwellia sp.]